MDAQGQLVASAQRSEALPRSVNAYRAIVSQVLAYSVEVYTKEQVEAVASEATDPTIAAIIRGAGRTGLRLGELLERRDRDWPPAARSAAFTSLRSAARACDGE